MFLAHLIAWTFNLVMLGADLIAIFAIHRCRQPRQLVFSGLALLVAAGVVALVIAGEAFLFMRLISFAVFLHFPLYLLASVILLRQHRWLSVSCALLMSVILAVAVDAFWLEPHWLEETKFTVRTSKLEQPLRIAVIADLQTDKFGEYEQSAIRRCMAHQPDLILLAGDYVQVEQAESWELLRTSINAFLRGIEFSAPLGVYAVQGNTDHPLWQQIFEGVGVKRMEQTQSIALTDHLELTGLAIMDSFNRRLVVQESPRFHIVLGHAPDYALGKVAADLLIAGHTHGGQVRLPVLGPLMTASAVPRAWAAGVTRLSGNRTLVVSRGIGMERRNAPRLRFLCRPELVVIDVVPED